MLMTAVGEADMRRAANDFYEKGFCILKNHLDARLLDEVEADIGAIFHERALAAGLSPSKPTTYAELSELIVALKQKDQPAYLQAAKACNHLASLSRLCVSKELMDAVSGLGLRVPTLATRTVLHFMADTLDIEGGYLKTPAHQDFRSVQGSLNCVVSWTPLAAVTSNDYPLQVAVGSHKLGLLPSQPHVFGHELSVEENGDFIFEDVILERRDLLLFSSLLVHRTGEKGGKQVRTAASFRYNDAVEPTYVGRGLPIPYIYKADMELRTPDFPTPHDVAEMIKENSAS